MNKFTPAAALTLLALAGCTPMAHHDLDATARDTRHILVDVVKGVITATPDPADLLAHNGRVRWVFGNNPDGYVFATNGITFDANPSAQQPLDCTSRPNPAPTFTNCRRLDPQGQTFQCNKVGPHVVGACFKYDIRVELPGGGKPIVKDPWAINR